MKALLVVLLVAVCMFFAAHMVYVGIVAWHNNQNVQFLTLADDASSPAQKAEYLGEFLSAIQKLDLPENARWVFKTERTKLSEQVKVIESLKQRCEELSKVDPKEMGYATGMQQVTGQEFDYATDKIEKIFKEAMWAKEGWYVCYGWIIEILCAILIIVILTFGEWESRPQGRTYNRSW